MRDEAYYRREFGCRGLVLPLLLFNAALACAEPAVLLEATELVPSDGDPYGGFGRSVAIDGNVAVVGATGGGPCCGPWDPGAAYVFERDAQGLWQETAKLTGTAPADAFGFDVAVDGNVIAVGDPFYERTHVFEKQGFRWVRTAVLGLAPSPTHSTGNGYSVAVHGNLIAISHRDDNGLALYQRGTNGWQRIAAYSDGFAEEDPTYLGPHVDVTAGIAVFGTPSLFEHGPAAGRLNLYSPGANGSWATPSVTSWPHPDMEGDFNGPVSISGNTLLASGWIYERNSSGNWVLTNTTTQANALDDDESTVIALDARYTLSRVFQRDASGEWARVAELIPSNALPMDRVAVNSQRVVAAGYRPVNIDGIRQPSQAYIFELPATMQRPSLLQDDFQDGNAQGWTALGGTFGVASSGTSLVYRQSNTTGNATSLLSNVSHNDQSIQADIIPRAFDGADRWFGLVARYVNASNYYYVTARSGGGIDLKKMFGGSFITLASAPLTVTLNRTHRLRLEAVGDHIRVLVNERPFIYVRDRDISGGQPGVMMYRTRADYDNVLVNANPGAPAFAENFDLDRFTMQEVGGSWGRAPGVYLQQDLTGGAQLLTAADGTYGDQIVEADLRPTQFSGTDRWLGLATRYVDAENYVYVTLRSSNTLQIKKLVDGSIQTLASVPFTVAANTTYRVRLETIGSRIRAYVNGEQKLEVSDTPTPSGPTRAGVVMYKTAVEIDNFLLFKP
jgi:hypothetical protein